MKTNYIKKKKKKKVLDAKNKIKIPKGISNSFSTKIYINKSYIL